MCDSEESNLREKALNIARSLTSVLNHRLTLTFYKNLARLIILQSAFFQMTIKDSLTC